MCGIAGIAGRPGLDRERGEIVRRMTATLVHRGPDGEGHAARDGCDLGFRRLAIVDLKADSPPFPNEDGSIWTVCNGEIYNYAELRDGLEGRGHRFRTRVDTEVLPHLYEEHGPDLVNLLDGMFAFAIWDERARRLVLGRDRAGEKPLFYWCGPDGLAFASELRGILAHPGSPRAVDPRALTRYLLHDYFPAPRSPLAGVAKLPAGHRLILEREDLRIERYWDLAEYFGRGQGAPPRLDAAATEVDRLLAQAVARRKRSDVPVGVFLSGGIDSSSVLAHLAEQNGPGVPAFTLGHEDPAFDESRFTHETARAFGADLHRLIVGEADLAAGLSRIGAEFDEPLGDASTIPTLLLSVFARQRVKVVLSGEGADELFGGYPTYLGNRIADGYRRIPGFLRRALVRGAKALVPVSMGNVGLDYLLGRFADGVERGRIERHHTWFGSLAPDLQSRVLSGRVREAAAGADPFEAARARLRGKRLPDGLSELLYMDFTMYLQDDLLTKVDRGTMLASLESRAPFLDHELAEYVASLPSSYKVRGMTTKAVLRRAVARRLPPAVLKRRKRGFNIPFSRWLLHGLGETLRARFSEERVRARGLLDPAGVLSLLEEHLSRRADHRKPLYTLLALDLWCDRTYGEGAPVPIAEGGGAR